MIEPPAPPLPLPLPFLLPLPLPTPFLLPSRSPSPSSSPSRSPSPSSSPSRSPSPSSSPSRSPSPSSSPSRSPPPSSSPSPSPFPSPLPLPPSPPSHVAPQRPEETMLGSTLRHPPSCSLLPHAPPSLPHLPPFFPLFPTISLQSPHSLPPPPPPPHIHPLKAEAEVNMLGALRHPNLVLPATPLPHFSPRPPFVPPRPPLQAEVNMLGTLRHPNLVTLIGYCMEGGSRLLVYELMERGSLDHYLFSDVGSPLPWGLRMRIALGVAQCLVYLHENPHRPIIYRDLKAANVLLDKDFNPKLADFGLAKDGPVGDKTHVTTQVVGTYGYADPDYLFTGHLTPKSDVYGFGVLLLELLSGRQASDFPTDEEDESRKQSRTRGNSEVMDAEAGDEDDEEEDEGDLLEWAEPMLADRKRVEEVMDPRLGREWPARGVQKAALLVLHCTARNPYERPMMSSVVKTLRVMQQGYTWPPAASGGDAGGGGGASGGGTTPRTPRTPT
ncbi:unnamed protein product [Closterium sp. NIES-65]|nr:unnamed protein product [Closterium sp. NIES-65]